MGRAVHVSQYTTQTPTPEQRAAAQVNIFLL